MGIDNAIDITPAQRKELLGLLSRHLPGTAVWAFGSRVKWTSRPESDMDLVAFSTPQQQSRIAALKEALEESSLPFRVDLLVWDDIPESFQENIRRAYVVLVDGSAGKRGGGGSDHHKVLPYSFPSHWNVLKLRDVCKKIGSGATPTGGQSAYLPIRQHWALVRSQNVFDRYFDATGLAFISDEQASALQGVALQSGDVLFNITGDGVTFARSCAVPEWVLPAVVNQHVSIVRPNPDMVDPGYVMAYLTHPAIKGYIEGFNTGGSRRAVTKGHIESFDIPLPTIDEQRTIAHILGTLDDKIELNRRMNDTLEAMARAIFQSWFVDFDPVHAKANGESPDSICQRLGLTPELLALFPDSFEDSELGEIPTGWQLTRLDEILELAYGKALKATDRIDGSVPVYGSGGVTGYHNESLIEGPSIIVGRKRTVGSLYWEDRVSFPIDTVFYVKPKAQLAYCYYLLQTLGLETMNTDAAVPGLNRNNVYRLLTPLPGKGIRDEFDRLAKSFRSQIRLSAEGVVAISSIRDALLPKLLCGELPVDGRARVGEDYEGMGLMIYPAQKAKSPGEPTEAMTPTRNPQSI